MPAEGDDGGAPEDDAGGTAPTPTSTPPAALGESPTSTGEEDGTTSTDTATDLDGVASEDANATTTDVSYFDVFFSYRMDLSDPSMTASVVEEELGDTITSTIASILDENGISRRRRAEVVLSKSASDPIQQVNYEDSQSSDDDSDALSCVLIVSLVRVEAKTGTEDQESANDAIQTRLRTSMSPINTMFQDAMDVDEIVRVEWITGGILGDDKVELSSTGGGNGDGGGMSSGGIIAISVCSTALVALALFVAGKYRRNRNDSSYHDIDEESELRAADGSIAMMRDLESGNVGGDGEVLMQSLDSGKGSVPAAPSSVDLENIPDDAREPTNADWAGE